MAASKKPLRNWAATDPLMRKGGVHSVPKLQVRPRLDWRQALDDYSDWQNETSATVIGSKKEEPQGSSSVLALA